MKMQQGITILIFCSLFRFVLLHVIFDIFDIFDECQLLSAPLSLSNGEDSEYNHIAIDDQISPLSVYNKYVKASTIGNKVTKENNSII